VTGKGDNCNIKLTVELCNSLQCWASSNISTRQQKWLSCWAFCEKALEVCAKLVDNSIVNLKCLATKLDIKSPVVTLCTTRLNVQKFYVVPTQCICVFCVDLRTNSDYLLYSINWLVFITETQCVYCAVRSAHTVCLCVLCGSENKQRLFHCTAFTDCFPRLAPRLKKGFSCNSAHPLGLRGLF
jgi:hypothetical protein